MFRLELIYDGVVIERINLECSMLSALKQARNLLHPKQVTVVNIYKDDQWIKQYMC